MEMPAGQDDKLLTSHLGLVHLLKISKSKSELFFST